MVIGLDTYKTYFKDFSDCYVIIGGTACDIIIDDAGLTPRATKDIDIILVIEALTSDFANKFWDFVKDGKYEQRERSPEKLEYFRFLKPKEDGFPKQVELFSREPDAFTLPEESQLTPIPVDDDISSLSAILMNEDYYHFTIKNSVKEDDIHRANTPALIVLKAKAYLDLKQRKEQGEQIDNKNINKHKTDVFRLGLLLAGNEAVALPESIKTELEQFFNTIGSDLPDKGIFKNMGAGNVDPRALFDQLLKTFQIS